MKLIHCTDFHIDVTTPVSRTDDYFADSMATLEYILNYTKSSGARALIMSGDFFDKPIQPGTVMYQVAKLLKEYAVDVYTTIGQHDTNGHNADDYPIKSVGILEAAGLLKVLKNGSGVVLDDTVCVRGYAFNEPETDEFLEGRDPLPEDALLHIALVHATVGPDDCMGWAGISHQNIKTADLVLFGDVHCGFVGHAFASGAYAIGAGSVGRRRLEDIGRAPKIVEIEVKGDGSYSLAYHALPTLPDADIFDMSMVNAGEEALDDSAANFKEEWTKAQAVRDESNIERVRRIGASFEHSVREIGLVLENLPCEAA